MSDGLNEALRGTYFMSDKYTKISEITISGSLKSKLTLITIEALKQNNIKFSYDNDSKKIIIYE